MEEPLYHNPECEQVKGYPKSPPTISFRFTINDRREIGQLVQAVRCRKLYCDKSPCAHFLKDHSDYREAASRFIDKIEDKIAHYAPSIVRWEKSKQEVVPALFKLRQSILFWDTKITPLYASLWKLREEMIAYVMSHYHDAPYLLDLLSRNWWAEFSEETQKMENLKKQLFQGRQGRRPKEDLAITLYLKGKHIYTDEDTDMSKCISLVFQTTPSLRELFLFRFFWDFFLEYGFNPPIESTGPFATLTVKTLKSLVGFCQKMGGPDFDGKSFLISNPFLPLKSFNELIETLRREKYPDPS